MFPYWSRFRENCHSRHKLTMTMTTPRRAERRRRFGGMAPLAAILLIVGRADAFSSQGISQSGLLIGRVPILLPARDVSVHSSRRRRRVPRRSSFCLQAESGDNDNDDEIAAEACPDNLDVATPLPLSSWKRLVQALPAVQRKTREDGTDHSNPFQVQLGDDLDRQILGTALPSMLNLAVVPVVNSVDVFWVGKLGSALALAGQAAANQAFFTLYCE